MKGLKSHIAIALVTVFVAAFAIFYVADNLDKISKRCSVGESLDVCNQVTGLTSTTLIILLIIGGFIVVASSVVYLILSS